MKKAQGGTFAYPMVSGSRIAPIPQDSNAASPRHDISYKPGELSPSEYNTANVDVSRCLIFQDGFKFARFET